MTRLVCACVRPGRGNGAPGLQGLDDGLVPGRLAPPAAVLHCPRRRRSSRWTWPWRGSMRPAASSPRSRPERSSRPTSTCSGSPRCWATTRPTVPCCAATPARSASWPRDGAAAVARFEAWLRAAERSDRRCASYGTLAAGVHRVRGHARRAGPLRRRDDRGVHRHAGRLPGQDRRAEAVRPAVLPQVRSRSRASPSPPRRKRSRRCRPASRPGSRRSGTRPSVARILEAVDRGNPCGKRDYAIILLVTRLGLRSIDVKRLKFFRLRLAGLPAAPSPGQDRPRGASCRC